MNLKCFYSFKIAVFSRRLHFCRCSNLVSLFPGEGDVTLSETTVGIYVFKLREADVPDNMGIVLKGQGMLQNSMNAWNLDYPPELRYTFEVLQKTVMKLKGNLPKKNGPGFLK
uniref:Uncharacterized protein n=1 Tax=Astyanax mexicanus TaxID=7994 RepID=A0A3B1J3G5_ASTMX